MTREEKMSACRDFFERLAEALSGGYELVGSCNHDDSVYLVPKDTEEQITYYGKPKKSFRLSDHWNWYANIKKCDNENYVQCLSVNIPWPNARPMPGHPSKPKYAAQVAVIGKGGKYYGVYGEMYDRRSKTWSWLEADPTDVARMVLSKEGIN